MKNIYIAPAQYVVNISTTKMMAESVQMYSSDSIDDANDILTKEVNNTNIWDNEW